MPIVTVRRGDINEADVRAGSAVRAGTWRSVARLNNWTLGGGGVIVPGHSPQVTLTAGTEYVLKYRTKPRYQSLERIWKIGVRGSGGPSDVLVAAPSTATSETLHADTSKDTALPYQFIEAVSSQSAAETELELEIKPTTNDCILESVACWEMPRADLAAYSDDDRGHKLTAFNPRQPIVAGPLDAASTTLEDTTLIGTRPALVSWAVPVTAGGVTTTSFAFSTTSGTPVDLWSLPIPILGRKVGLTSTTADITAKILCWVSDGTTEGEATVTTTSGGTSASVATIDTTSPTWKEIANLTGHIDCEDMASNDGRQTAASPAWDDVQINVTRTVGAGTVYVAAAWVGE